MSESMVERVGAALAAACMEEFGSTWSNDVRWKFARVAFEAMREADNDMLEAMHNAMFADEFDGTNLPMLQAGFGAAIDAALKETP
jgi:hypothetical protein